MMTKKDYIRAATLIQDLRRSKHFTHAGVTLKDVEDLFVEFFRADNPQFDPKRFREASHL